ncbi:prospero homeobox 3 [Myripristis murdjan]|uniref:prospero homeobox 3 n=1 Tax=Myripristis murdjan TaxID=586833 RepID=UPI001175FE6F|nr:prospero homeobox protein 1-like [Myripristis murdjan]
MMDSPTDLFDDAASQLHAFTPSLCTSELPGVPPQSNGGRPPATFRPPGYPLIHHLLQPGGAPRRIGGQLNAHNTNLGAQRHLESRIMEEVEERDGQVDQGMEGGEEGVMEGEEGLLGVKKRHSNVALMAEWSRDVLRVKRMKLESMVVRRDVETAEGDRRRERGREGRRREREELKEQLEEARERLQALQEKVWRAFGEKHMTEEEKKRRGRNENRRAADRGVGDMGLMEEEDVVEGIFDEEELDGGEMEKESLSLLPNSPFSNFGNHKRREERQKEQEGRLERGKGGGLHIEGLMEGAGVWMGCGGLVRGEWDGGMEGGDEEAEEGGQKFAQALKLELGSAVARVIDRVLRFYTETTDFTPPSPPPSISFLPSDTGNDGGRERGVWMGMLMAEREEDKKTRDKDERMGGQDGERENQLQKTSNGSMLPAGHRREHPADLAAALALRRSHDKRKANPLLGPPLPAHLPHSHPNLPLHHPSLSRPPPPHPSLLPPPSQPKDPASFHPSSSSSSSSSFPPPPPPPPPPLPLPLLHYSMQQLFSRSLHHPQLPHLPPSHKDYLNADPFLEFPPHPSSHPSFPPLPLLGHLDPSLAHHAHSDRERERGMRGDSGIRGGGGGMDGDLYLPPGGSQEGLSPCHLKKAKLMFFYTRYPSSNTLKTYFPDVKFNRCVTSQLIKWFSNFREFFYIQMERFARQAVREALTRDAAPRLGRDNQLRMGRDTELYRILNMHYNKSNVYQVPERFIEVAEVALREFYSAIQTGRDSDPCWKKGIYKIICKLDSPVPDAFRLPGCPVG